MIVEIKVEVETDGGQEHVRTIIDKLTQCIKAGIADLYVDGWVSEAKSVKISRIS
jgi:hypothetical protein